MAEQSWQRYSREMSVHNEQGRQELASAHSLGFDHVQTVPEAMEARGLWNMLTLEEREYDYKRQQQILRYERMRVSGTLPQYLDDVFERYNKRTWLEYQRD